MTRPPLSALTLARAFVVVGFAALAAITLAHPGATRMHAWPWSLGYAVALLAPALALILRGLDRGQPLARPGGDGTALALVAVAVVLVSALASPFRGPSLLWSAPLLAAAAWFFLLCDWRGGDPARRGAIHRAVAAAGLVLGAVSVGPWLASLRSGVSWLEARNAYPLGHASYTAGLALLVLPFAIGVAAHASGAWRAVGGASAGLAVVMLFTSGSRGGFLGLAALGIVALFRAPWAARIKIALGAAAAVAALLVAVAHPRMRATLLGGSGTHLVAASEVQRAAMTTAGGRMGADRPLAGWGPGTTPLVYPKYRGGLRGGAENVLQLHSLPAHVWAELGAGGLAVLLAAGVLAWRGRARDDVAFAAAAGYGAFALTDWQLDVPVFAFAAAVLGALLARPRCCHLIGDTDWNAAGEEAGGEARSRVGVQSAVGSAKAGAPRPRGLTTGHDFTAFLPSPELRRTDRKRGYASNGGIAVVTLAALALVILLGRPDPTPELNVRALAFAREPAQAERAIGLLRESLALNPDQEIAHFNLAWLLLVREPAAAERHFLAAARLVPDKGGVYFGVGLARLNQGRTAGAARALALECLHDPAFLASPWWREPAVAALREAAAAALADLVRRAAAEVTVPTGLRPELLGRVPDGPERVYRRERTGYPVLMRNLDLPPPRDLYDVREPAVLPPDVAALPGKGWLPGALPLTLLAPAEPPRS